MSVSVELLRSPFEHIKGVVSSFLLHSRIIMSTAFNGSSVFGTVGNEFFEKTATKTVLMAYPEVENISQQNGHKNNGRQFMDEQPCTGSRPVTPFSQNEFKTPTMPQFSPKAEKTEESVTRRVSLKRAAKPDINTPSALDENWKCLDHIIWINVSYFVLAHLGFAYGAYLIFTTESRKTTWFGIAYGVMGGLGITAGAHRLWTHRAYKAKLPLRIFLAFCNAIALQNSIYQWCRDHRLHHKYSETDADPHNSNRGFFFSHIGWLCCQKHPDVRRFGKKLDVSDLLNDPVVYYQRKYYIVLIILFSLILPTAIPCYFWNESVHNSFFIAAAYRYCLSLHFTWLVNSAAHLYGYRPYDKSIAPAENRFVSSLALGEGYHNFHHTFPWDYSTSEWGWTLNITTMFLDLMAKLGLAYDMRKVTPEMIAVRQARTGNNISPVFFDERKSEFA